jgi:hypothetical protein
VPEIRRAAVLQGFMALEFFRAGPGNRQGAARDATDDD